MIAAMKHAGFTGRIGVAREDITPPVGIYCRNWGAAKHDTAEGVHRPLTLTTLTLQSDRQATPLVLVDADLTAWWSDLPFERRFRRRVLAEIGLDASQYIFGCSHTHSAPPLCDPEPQWQGGDLVPEYTEKVYAAVVQATRRALAAAQPTTLEWHTGRCSLASNRDLRDGRRFVCGYNPEIRADDTLVVGRVTDAAGKITVTIVNYACHPTTLAWQNKLISPDFVGAMRETMQQETGATAMFLQGASGELSPKYQYVGDTGVADMHGRQLGFAALATLAEMEPPGCELVYDGIVESGAPLATWKRQQSLVSRKLCAVVRTVELPLKDWPAAAELKLQHKTCPDRTMAERLRRKLRIREALGDDKTYPLEVWVWRVGDAVIVGSLVEAYSCLQQKLRSCFPGRTIVWMNLINGSIGYLPPAPSYDEDVYQVWQTPFERGGLEALTEAAEKAVRALFPDE
jgi:hypothetical protein